MSLTHKRTISLLNYSSTEWSTTFPYTPLLTTRWLHFVEKPFSLGQQITQACFTPTTALLHSSKQNGRILCHNCTFHMVCRHVTLLTLLLWHSKSTVEPQTKFWISHLGRLSSSFEVGLPLKTSLTHLIEAWDYSNCERDHSTETLEQCSHVMWHAMWLAEFTCSEAKPPAGTQGDPVENLSNSAFSSSLRLSTSFQNHWTMLSDSVNPQYCKEEPAQNTKGGVMATMKPTHQQCL